MHNEQVRINFFFSKSRNKRLQCNDQLVRNDIRTYDNIRKIALDQVDDYTTGCSLDYVYFENYYKMIAIDLSKQQALDVDPKTIQQIYFIENLD